MKIVHMNAMRVVGIPVEATWENLWIEMPKTWRDFIARHTEIQHRCENTFLDVSVDRRGDMYLQLICAQVTHIEEIPEGMRAIEIPSQRYIHYQHVGPVEAIAESFGKMYDWAHEHGYSVGEFKIDKGYTAEGEELEHDLYIGLMASKSSP